MRLKYFILFLTLLFITTSCGPSKKVSDTVPAIKQDVTWADLRWFITKDNKINADADVFADEFYTIVDEDFFNKNILNQFKSFLTLNGVDKATPDSLKNDCNKFARGFSFFSRVKSFQLKDLKYSLPVADYYYYVFGDHGHAVNIAVVFDNKTRLKKLIYIEPQNQSIIDTKTSPDFTNQFFVAKFVGM